MEEENVQAQEEVVEQEEQTSEEIDSTEETQDENITLTKAEFTKMQRKAMAYDANKSKPKPNYKASSKEQALDDEIVKTVKNLDLLEKKRQFGYENELSPEETDFVFKISNGKPTKEILKDPFVKNGIDGFRQSKRIADNTPGSTSRSPVFGTKNFNEMSHDERKSQFEQASKKFQR